MATADRSAAAARRLLRRVFASVRTPMAFRLWDGSTTQVGGPEASPFTVVFRAPRVLRQSLRRPTPLAFGEAYIGGDLDLEGDLFAAMRVANEIEQLRVPFGTRLAVLAGLLRI